MTPDQRKMHDTFSHYAAYADCYSHSRFTDPCAWRFLSIQNSRSMIPRLTGTSVSEDPLLSSQAGYNHLPVKRRSWSRSGRNRGYRREKCHSWKADRSVLNQYSPKCSIPGNPHDCRASRDVFFIPTLCSLTLLA